MATPNMDTITASLERALQKFSLNHQQSSSSSSGGAPPHGPDSQGNPSSDAALELNSQALLPAHWEQCLDLKTGEIYFINWRTGMKATEDPRSTTEYGGGYYSEDDCSSYEDSDWSSSESSPSRGQWSGGNNSDEQENLEKEKNNNTSSNINSNNVLVVTGCKSCLRYYMVPKQLEICPNCCGQLLHFVRSEYASP